MIEYKPPATFADVLAESARARAEREAQHTEARDQYKREFRAELRWHIGVEDGRTKKVNWMKYRDYLTDAYERGYSFRAMADHIRAQDGVMLWDQTVKIAMQRMGIIGGKV